MSNEDVIKLAQVVGGLVEQVNRLTVRMNVAFELLEQARLTGSPDNQGQIAELLARAEAQSGLVAEGPGAIRPEDRVARPLTDAELAARAGLPFAGVEGSSTGVAAAGGLQTKQTVETITLPDGTRQTITRTETWGRDTDTILRETEEEAIRDSLTDSATMRERKQQKAIDILEQLGKK